MRTNLGTKNGNPETDAARRLNRIEQIIQQIPSRFASVHTTLPETITVRWNFTGGVDLCEGDVNGTAVWIDGLTAIQQFQPGAFGSSVQYKATRSGQITRLSTDTRDLYVLTGLASTPVYNKYILSSNGDGSAVVCDSSAAPVTTSIAGVNEQNILLYVDPPLSNGPSGSLFDFYFPSYAGIYAVPDSLKASGRFGTAAAAPFSLAHTFSGLRIEYAEPFIIEVDIVDPQSSGGHTWASWSRMVFRCNYSSSQLNVVSQCGLSMLSVNPGSPSFYGLGTLGTGGHPQVYSAASPSTTFEVSIDTPTFSGYLSGFQINCSDTSIAGGGNYICMATVRGGRQM